MKVKTRVQKTARIAGESREEYARRVAWAYSLSRREVYDYADVHFPVFERSTVLVIPDLHAPAIHPLAFDFLRWVRDTYQCDECISIGDVVDLHSISFHTTDPDIVGGNGEIEAAAKSLEPFHREFPNIPVTMGNHDARIARKVFSAGIPARVLIDLADVIGCPSWKFVPHEEVDGVWYQHDAGGGINGAANTALELQQPVVAGHTHKSFGAVYKTSRLWGMQVGTLVNPSSPRFAYARNAVAKTRLGCGVVVKGVTPIPVTLNAFQERGRPR